MNVRNHSASFACLLVSFPCVAQSCSPYGLDGINACIQPTDGSNNAPVMPLLDYAPDPCTVSSINLAVQYSNSIATPFNQTAGLYASGDLSAGGDWIVDWTENLIDKDHQYEGGAAVTVTNYTGNRSATNYSWTLYGINPSFGSLTGFMQANNAPWWFGHALSQESSNRQFDSSGNLFSANRTGSA